MKRIYLLLAAVAAVLAIGIGSSPVTAQQPTGPTAGTKLTGDLNSPRGMKVGPDGMIYIAEAGSGGTTVVGPADNSSMSGNTGRISKIDPATGTRTTVADNLPSNAGSEGDAVGPADVAFIGSQLYYVQTHGGAAYGFPNNPTGLYKVNSNGTVTLVADIGKFNIATPVNDISSGTQQDIEIGGNPYAMTVRDGAFLVTDGNQNQVMKITTAGAITRLNEFPGHPVTTGITFNGSGPLFVSALGQFPFAAADGKVYQVGYPSGSVSTVASGVSSLTDVEFSGSQLYALNFADQAPDLSMGPWIPFTGKLMKLDASTGTFTPIVTGFTATTAVIFIGDTAYVSNNGVPFVAPGEVWKIANVSSLAALPAPAPTAAAPAPTAPVAAPTGAPSGVIVGPNTGTAGISNEADGRVWIPMLVLAIIGIAALGGAVVTKRR